LVRVKSTVKRLIEFYIEKLSLILPPVILTPLSYLSLRPTKKHIEKAGTGLAVSLFYGVQLAQELARSNFDNLLAFLFIFRVIETVV
jgi:hypothetical protein